MNSFDTKLIKLLIQDDRFTDQNGELIVAAVTDRAWKFDPELVKLLLRDEEIKKEFFQEIEGHWIFNANEFIDYVGDKNFLVNSYTRFRNKIGLNIGGKFLRERGEVTLAWPYKDCVLEGGQTKDDQKRKEIFFNETLARDEIGRMFARKALTGWRRCSAEDAENGRVGKIKRDADSVIQENMLIKGNNLIALHSLIPQFRAKVKLIYIDPPYNTGGSTDSFSYNNSFKHSTWLTFIRNRIEAAKELLKNDGFMAVTIDHVELFYLGALLDEIFGAENRIGIVTIYINPKGRQHERFFSAATEHMLVYAKDISKAKFNKVALDKDKIESFDKRDEEGNYRLEQFMRVRSDTSRTNKPKFWYPIYVSKDLTDITLSKKERYHEVFPIDNGREFTWKTKPETFEKRNVGGYFVAVEQDEQIEILHKYHEQQVIKNLWTDKKYFPEFQGTNLLKNLLGRNIFSYPKSLYAVFDTLKIMTGNDDVVLDFFAGSGTTGHAVLELNREDGGNRRFILVEQLDAHIDVCRERLEKVMAQEGLMDNGDFLYCELAPYNQSFMDRIQSASSSDELFDVWADMSENSFLNWYVNPEDPANLDEAVENFIALGEEPDGLNKQKRLLAELLDKSQLYVHYSEIDDPDFNISEEDKELTRQFYEDGSDDS